MPSQKWAAHYIFVMKMRLLTAILIRDEAAMPAIGTFAALLSFQDRLQVEASSSAPQAATRPLP